MFKFIILITISLNIFALTSIATVDIVRGEVTKLLPGALIANKVKAGDKLFEDTSIVTSSRSFVKILFNDKSKISIGPQSKIVLSQVETKEGSVISLLKGKLRSSVERTQDSNKNKFYIKTRTAALGVRGTDFQTIYNPENKITNLLTFRGKVAMANIENESHIKVDQEVEVERDSKGRIQVKKKSVSQKQTEIKNLDDVLSKKDSVVVAAGQFSGTTTQVDNVSKPVKINPVQLGMLYKNDTFIEKSSDASMNIKDAQNITDFIKLEQANQDVPAEGIYDKENGVYAPKSGGFIDIETALYIPPEKDAKFDIEKQIYIPSQVGQLEVDTGAYIPPAGLKIDPREGFVLINNRSGDDNLIAKKVTMNGNLGKELFIEKEEVNQLKIERYSLRELQTKDIVIFSLSGHSSEYMLTEAEVDNINIPKTQEFEFEGSNQFSLDWKMAGNGEYQPFFNFNYRTVNFENDKGFALEDSSLYGASFGVNKYLTSRVFLTSKIKIQQELLPILIFDNTNYIQKLSKASLTYISFGAQYQFAKWSNNYLAIHGELSTTLHKKTNELSAKNGFGNSFSFDYGHWFNTRSFLLVQLYNDSIQMRINSGTFSAKNELSSGGLRLSYGHIF